MGVFGMVGILRYCLFGFLSFSVLTAHAQRTVIVEPSQIERTYGAQPFQFSDSRNWNATVSTQSGARVTVPVVSSRGYSAARVGNMIKTAINSNPVKYAATAAATYLITQLPGASFDPITGLPVMTQSSSTPLTGIPTGTTYKWAVSGSQLQRFSPLEACRAEVPVGTWLMHSTAQPPTQMQVASHRIVGTSETTKTCLLDASNTAVGSIQVRTVLRSGSTCPTGSSYSTALNSCAAVLTVPFSASDYDALVSNTPSLTPQHWADIAPTLYNDFPASFEPPDQAVFTGPPSIDLPSTTTTSTNPSTGQTTVTDTLPSLQFEYSTNPNAITTTPTTVTNTYQNGNLTNTTTTTTNTTTTTTPTPVAEIPTDCKFMPTVCAFIEWYRQPFDEPEPDLSDIIADDEFSESFVFNQSAQCPPPANISTAFGNFEFSYQPACQWAGMIKPLIIMAALLSAIFINLGSVRGND